MTVQRKAQYIVLFISLLDVNYHQVYVGQMQYIYNLQKCNCNFPTSVMFFVSIPAIYPYVLSGELTIRIQHCANFCVRENCSFTLLSMALGRV